MRTLGSDLRNRGKELISFSSTKNAKKRNNRGDLFGFFRIATVGAALVLLLWGAAWGGEYFRVEMVKPQHFMIETLVPGPVATSSRGPQTQIRLRQQHGRTVVHAVVPPCGELQLTVGSHRLRLWVTDDGSYQVQEE
jgi:hypothetical protein